MMPFENLDLQNMANALRILAIDTIEKAQSGHPGLPLGMADVMTVLWSRFLVHTPMDPTWPNRDRFVLSAGHGCALLYGLLHLTGYRHPSLKDLQSFRQHHSSCHGHPERGPGIEVTTGPLGQGFANAVGLAMAQCMRQAEFPFIDHRTYVLVSDGDLMEGISQEALSLAGHWRLNKLVVLFDDNNITIDGPCALARSEDTHARFRASGWDTYSVDGHDLKEIEATLSQALTDQTKPVLIACRTHIGWGCPSKQDDCGVHGSPLGPQGVTETRLNLHWPLETPFEIPGEFLNQWKTVGQRHERTRQDWTQRVKAHALGEQFLAEQFKDRCTSKSIDFSPLRTHYIQKKPFQATRKSSGQVLEALYQSALAQNIVVGSADLAQSTQILPSGNVFSKENPSGRYVHYGIREHAMAAMMNGLAAYDGSFIPIGGTFLAFSDYARPAIRLSALMGLQVIYVMTHDSIGLGQDGPTHQPIEHLASLRAMPGLCVFRPADALETLECWQLALKRKNGPSLLALSRQDTPCVRQDQGQTNLSALGAYVLKETDQKASQVDLFSTGTEVSIALEVQKALEDDHIGARVISMPSWFLFDAQPQAYRTHIVHPSRLKVAIEAASPFGWERYVGQDGCIFALKDFGASGPSQDLYTHFHLTPEAIVQGIKKELSKRSF